MLSTYPVVNSRPATSGGMCKRMRPLKAQNWSAGCRSPPETRTYLMRSGPIVAKQEVAKQATRKLPFGKYRTKPNDWRRSRDRWSIDDIPMHSLSES